MSQDLQTAITAQDERLPPEWYRALARHQARYPLATDGRTQTGRAHRASACVLLKAARARGIILAEVSRLTGYPPSTISLWCSSGSKTSKFRGKGSRSLRTLWLGQVEAHKAAWPTGLGKRTRAGPGERAGTAALTAYGMEKGLSVAQIARDMGYSQASLWRWHAEYYSDPVRHSDSAPELTGAAGSTAAWFAEASAYAREFPRATYDRTPVARQVSVVALYGRGITAGASPHDAAKALGHPLGTLNCWSWQHRQGTAQVPDTEPEGLPAEVAAEPVPTPGPELAPEPSLEPASPEPQPTAPSASPYTLELPNGIKVHGLSLDAIKRLVQG